MKHYVKYNNRKIYAKNSQGYTTVNALLDEVRGGADVRVTCYRTKLDVTDLVLSEALTRLKLPTETLVNIIRGVK